jgi:hypothetical protein
MVPFKLASPPMFEHKAYYLIKTPILYKIFGCLKKSTEYIILD